MSPCDIFQHGDVTVIACTRGPRRIEKCACGRAPRFLCDAPVGGGKTCDRPLCGRCARWSRTMANTHYCAEHEDQP